MAKISVNDLKERITIERQVAAKTEHGYTIYVPEQTLLIYANVKAYNADFNEGKLEVRNSVRYTIIIRDGAAVIHANDVIIYRSKRLKVSNEPVPAIDKRFLIFNAEELIENSSENSSHGDING